MEEHWIADRAALRALLRDHPDWSHSHLARTIGRSVSWVKKWRTRLRAAPPDDPTVLCVHETGRSSPSESPRAWTGTRRSNVAARLVLSGTYSDAHEAEYTY